MKKWMNKGERNMKNHSKKLYDIPEVKDYRELLNNTVSKYPDHIAYKYKKDPTAKEPEYVEISYKQFQTNVKEVSTALLELGLEGKKVILIGNNRYEWCTSYLAITTGNMIVVPLDKALPANEIEALVLRSGAEAAIFDKKYEEEFLKIKSNKQSNLKFLICMDQTNDKAEVMEYENLQIKGKEAIEKGNKVYDNMIIDPEKMSIMLFTSGTTSLPKAVMLSQRNICSNIQGIASYVKMYPTDTLLSFLPIHHTFECTVTFLYGIYYGVTVAFCDGLKYIAKNLAEYKVTVFVAVPLVLETMYKKITKAIEEKGKTKLIHTMSKLSHLLLKCKIDVRRVLFKQILDQFGGALRVVFYGAAPMNKDTIIGYNDLGIKLLQGYGLTETSPVIACETDEKQRPGSVGYPLYNLEVEIDGKDENGSGEIKVKGPNVMQGYYQNPEKTAEVLRDGWFYTGDYGYLDEDGFLYITGRKSDMIVLRNGKNIYPQELEFLINKISYVEESIVYAREKTNTDTTIGAKIVYNEDLIKEFLGEKTEEEYKEIIWNKIKEINQSLPTYKHIKEIMITKEPLDKTTTQKVKRYQEMKKISSNV